MAGREDPELAKLMERYVCVRIVQGWGLDLSVFQFDWRQTWMVFLMNADRAIYGRYDERQADDIPGLRQALDGALELHSRWPANKAELAGKTGPAPRWKSPEEMPALQTKGFRKPALGRDGCIHCHTILEGATASYKTLGEPVPEQLFAPYPTPQRVGLMITPKSRVTVTHVDKKSPAEAAGFHEGDRILRFGGQPILSGADLQWVLYTSDGPIKAGIERDGKALELTLTLSPGWRTR